MNLCLVTTYKKLTAFARRLSQAEQRLPAEALLTERQPLCNFQRANLHPIYYLVTRFYLEEILPQTPHFQPPLSKHCGSTHRVPIEYPLFLLISIWAKD